MKGLLRKDLYVLYRQWRVMLIFQILYALLAAFTEMSFFFVVINVFLGMMTVQTVMTLDERSKWEAVAVTLPVTRAQFVLERYVVGILSGIFGAALVAGTMFLAHVLVPDRAHLLGGSGMLLALAGGFFCMALNLPVSFKFGSTKGRLWMVGILAVTGGVSGAAASLTGNGNPAGADAGQLMAGFPFPAAAGAFAAALAVVAVSFVISLKFYEKREF